VTAVMEGGASVPSSICAEPGCDAPTWRTRVRGIDGAVAVSNYCREHSYQPLLEVLDEPVTKPGARVNPDTVFHKEVARRRESEDET
jgi:hypothetical protein